MRSLSRKRNGTLIRARQHENGNGELRKESRGGCLV